MGSKSTRLSNPNCTPEMLMSGFKLGRTIRISPVLFCGISQRKFMDRMHCYCGHHRSVAHVIQQRSIIPEQAVIHLSGGSCRPLANRSSGCMVNPVLLLIQLRFERTKECACFIVHAAVQSLSPAEFTGVARVCRYRN